MRFLNIVAVSTLFVGDLFLTGCIMYPYAEKNTVAVRYGSGTNIIEKLVQSESGVAGSAAISPEGPGSWRQAHKFRYYVERSSGSRTEVTCLSFLRKEDALNQLVQRCVWYVRPVVGTNQWVAVNFLESRNHGSHGTNKWDHDVFLKVYVFTPTDMVCERRLMTFSPWHHNNAIPDFRLDETNQHLTYMVTNGFEMYDLLQDVVHPSGVPAGGPALTIKDFGGLPAGGMAEPPPD
jgi:hypothetical protein